MVEVIILSTVQLFMIIIIAVENSKESIKINMDLTMIPIIHL